MVPLAFVVSTVLGIWKRVVEPMLLIEKRVEVAVPPVDEAMAKSVVGEPTPVVEVAWTLRSAKGVEEPIPTRCAVLGKMARPSVDVAHLELADAEPVSVIGVAPRISKVVQETEPEHVTVVVAAEATPAPPVEYRI
jgi:hypothetical protein